MILVVSDLEICLSVGEGDQPYLELEQECTTFCYCRPHYFYLYEVRPPMSSSYIYEIRLIKE